MKTTAAAGSDAGPAPVVAVIDIGSSAIRLVVAEIDSVGNIRRLDRASKPVTLGRDVFLSRHLSAETIRQAVRVLTGFCEVIQSWGINKSDVTVIATSAIREARNRDNFLDRVLVQTGLSINIIEGIEENHLTYVAVQHAIESLRADFVRSNSIIIEVGGGTTEVMLLKRGRMVAAHSLRIGTVRLRHQLRGTWDTGVELEAYLREQFRVAFEGINAELPFDRIRFFTMVGGDARIVAQRIGRQAGEHLWVIDRADFIEFVESIQRMNVDECVRRLSISYHDAEGLVSGLVIHKLFFSATVAERIIVPDVSIREGVLLNYVLGQDADVARDFRSQVIASAISLARKYHADEAHALYVAELALNLFDQTRSFHGLDAHSRLLLEVAAILHDIGYYIRDSGHHKHGQYIVANSEIFGCSREDIGIISQVVRYHRNTMPMSTHTGYVSMRREHRMIVQKLAAIVRVCDALDRGHSQRIAGFAVARTDSEITLTCERDGEISVEREALKDKGRMFEEVFGYRVLLV